MWIRAKIFPFIPAALTLAVLGAIAAQDYRGYARLFFAAPLAGQSPAAGTAAGPDSPAGCSQETLEDINEEEFLITCELAHEGIIQVEGVGYEVAVKGCGYTYPFIMRSGILSGGFFTAKDQENSAAVAVMNKKAAFDIFGAVSVVGNTFTMGGKTFAVAGVIDDTGRAGSGEADRNLQRNLYVPMTLYPEERPDTFMCALEGSVTQERITSVLKQAGVVETKYKLVNLGVLVQVIRGKFWIALIIGAYGLGLWLIGKCWEVMAGILTELRQLRKQFYLKELLRQNFNRAAALVLLALLTAAIAAALAAGGRLAVELAAVWRGCVSPLFDLNLSAFTDTLAFIRGCDLLSNIFFAVFAVGTAGAVIHGFIFRARSKD
ncbi:MAG: ABC transporter permease [Clostridiales bacterium]|nr:ABC transporter permease [Clostridiales bacterium]